MICYNDRTEPVYIPTQKEISHLEQILGASILIKNWTKLLVEIEIEYLPDAYNSSHPSDYPLPTENRTKHIRYQGSRKDLSIITENMKWWFYWRSRPPTKMSTYKISVSESEQDAVYSTMLWGSKDPNSIDVRYNELLQSIYKTAFLRANLPTFFKII